MENTVIEVTVIQDGRTSTERFPDRESAEFWITYKEDIEDSTAKYEINEVSCGIFGRLCTYEGKYFPTGLETETHIQVAKGIKLGLTPGTWIPDPNNKHTLWRLKV